MLHRQNTQAWASEGTGKAFPLLDFEI